MLARSIASAIYTVVRKNHNAPVKFIGQTPKGFVHNGWANARFPVDNTCKWCLGIKIILICTVGFWAPWIVVEYQLRKANQ